MDISRQFALTAGPLTRTVQIKRSDAGWTIMHAVEENRTKQTNTHFPLPSPRAVPPALEAITQWVEQFLNEIDPSPKPMDGSEIVNVQCADLGITYQDVDYTERTIIVRGTVYGHPIAGAVLLDAEGNAMDSQDPFDVEGVENFEMAARLFANAHDLSDSHCALIEHSFKVVAEQIAKGNIRC